MAQIATFAPAAQRWQRMLAPAITIGGLGAATLALHFRDPHASGSWGMCPSAMLGISCPGCGGLRAVNDLTNFQLVDAASSNLLFVLALPLRAGPLGRRPVARHHRVADVNWSPPPGWSPLVFTVLATCLSSTG